MASILASVCFMFTTHSIAAEGTTFMLYIWPVHKCKRFAWQRTLGWMSALGTLTTSACLPLSSVSMLADARLPQHRPSLLVCCLQFDVHRDSMAMPLENCILHYHSSIFRGNQPFRSNNMSGVPPASLTAKRPTAPESPARSCVLPAESISTRHLEDVKVSGRNTGTWQQAECQYNQLYGWTFEPCSTCPACSTTLL